MPVLQGSDPDSSAPVQLPGREFSARHICKIRLGRPSRGSLPRVPVAA